jgi:hypothetical protein
LYVQSDLLFLAHAVHKGDPASTSMSPI